MKQFFKFMFASVLGTFIAAFALFFVFFIIIAGAIGSAMSDLDRSGQTTSVKDNSILHIKLDRPIVDRGPEQTFNLDFGPFRSVSPIGLDQIIENLKKAKEDDRIEGIYLEVSFPMAGMATLEEIRNALLDFKESGKWIVSYSELYSQNAYYLSSVSDEIYLMPEGELDFRGLSTTIPFLKGMFDKLDIEMQVIRGSNNKFKSAVEPFLTDEMSVANRQQTETWMNSLWANMLSAIGESRGISADRLAAIADGYEVREPEDAVALEMVTAMKYNDEVQAILRAKTETEEDEKLNTVSLTSYFRARTTKSSETFVPSYKKDKIAIIYASGNIMSGKGDDETIGSETLSEAISEARKDSSIKAIVLRVNSPGGSALASEVIWRETALAKAVKPLVVSMGDAAASGGYYIAADAHKILAMPSTITGSIGVFGLMPNMKGFFNQKVGVTFDGVKTGKYADYGQITRPLSDEEYSIRQNGVDQAYDRFVSVVSQGRSMSVEMVDSIGQGRVWSGTDALAIGLVDELGGLNRAIEIAAELASVEDYTIKNLPKRKDPFEAFIEELTGQSSTALLRWQLGNDEYLLRQFKAINQMKEMSGVQAIIPYAIEIR